MGAGGIQHPGWRGLSLGPLPFPCLSLPAPLPGLLWSGLRTEAMPRMVAAAPTLRCLQC